MEVLCSPCHASLKKLHWTAKPLSMLGPLQELLARRCCRERAHGGHAHQTAEGPERRCALFLVKHVVQGFDFFMFVESLDS